MSAHLAAAAAQEPGAAEPGKAPRPAQSADDPSPRIEAVFTQIGATRMQGLPYLNPRLAVAAVGFQRWQTCWIGVLVTPWGINLLQLPTPDAPFPPWRADQTFDVPLPGATLSFMPARIDALGDYRLCPLFSPAQQFTDQESALATAREVLRLLFTPESGAVEMDASAIAAATVTATAESATTAAPAPPAPAHPAPNAANPSRRRLFGRR
jgi:[NiFe] hydrogenase assembly HybE family chaperone